MTDADHGDEAPPTYRIPEATGKREWRLSLLDDRLRFEADDRAPQEVLRAEVPDRLEFGSPMFGAVLVFLILADKKRVALRPPPDALAALNEWLGPPTWAELKATLARRLKWTLWPGVALTLFSLPLLEQMEFEPVLF